ncbi:hypothetical protein ES319_A08G229700v1, partial [Gossypium barbadense]
ESWDLLRSLAQHPILPWVCIGDFNHLLSVNDKWGGVEYPTRWLNGFRDCIMDCHLSKPQLVGSEFTWERGRGADSFVMERLDRAFMNSNWTQLFPLFWLFNLVSSTSDHNPFLFVYNISFPSRRMKRFKFE